MSVTRSLTFLWTPWTVTLSAVAVLATALYSMIAWRRAGYRLSMGLLELLRVAIVAIVAVLLNQPEWIEEFRPEEKPAIAVLLDASPSMDTRDVVAADQPTSSARTRSETIAPMSDPSAWDKLRQRMNVIIQPFSAPAASTSGGAGNGNGQGATAEATRKSAAGSSGRGTDLFEPLARAGADRQPAGNRAGLRRRLERGTAARAGRRPVEDQGSAGARRARRQPHQAARCRGAEPGCPDVRHRRQVGAGPVHRG